MNEAIFLIHIFIVAGFAVGALRLGRSSLTAMAALSAVLANLFVMKQISLFGFTVTCSDVFSVAAILTLNLLQEHFGKEAATEAVKISFFALVFFTLMSMIHLLYIPSVSDETSASFKTILSSTPRIVLASVAVFALVQKIDVALFGYLKQRQIRGRLGISLVISQFLDTVLFSFAGLYGIVASISDVIALSYMVKVAILLLSVPFVSFTKRFVKDAPVSL